MNLATGALHLSRLRGSRRAKLALRSDRIVDAVRVGAPSTRTVRLVETPPPQPSPASGRGSAPSSGAQSNLISSCIRPLNARRHLREGAETAKIRAVSEPATGTQH